MGDKKSRQPKPCCRVVVHRSS